VQRCRADGGDFVRPVPDALVARDGQPACRADLVDPLGIGRVHVEVIAARFDGSGGIAQRPFDHRSRHAVVGGHLLDGVAGAKAVFHDLRAHEGAADDGSAEGAGRVDHHRARLGLAAVAQERVREQRHWQAALAAIDARQSGLEVGSQCLLAAVGHVQQLAGLLHEQGHAVGAELAGHQGTLDAQLLADVVEGPAHHRQGHAMTATHGRQHVQLAEVGERQQALGRRSRRDDGLEAPRLAEAPGPHRGARQGQDARGLGCAIGRLVL
jgi:hypothetical protein